MLTKLERETLSTYLNMTGELVEMIAAMVAKLPPEVASTRTLLACELVEVAHDLRRAKMHLRPFSGIPPAGSVDQPRITVRA